MMTVHEVSGLTGVSMRTLQYDDGTGLLHPAGYTEAGAGCMTRHRWIPCSISLLRLNTTKIHEGP